jgi:very-short-patch-repair endonuclease
MKLYWNLGMVVCIHNSTSLERLRQEDLKLEADLGSLIRPLPQIKTNKQDIILAYVTQFNKATVRVIPQVQISPTL